MDIQVDDKWKVALDMYGNYTPHQYRVTKKGAKIVGGGISEGAERWVSEGFHFPTLGQALGYINNEEIIENYSSIKEYLDKKEQSYKELVQGVKELNL